MTNTAARLGKESEQRLLNALEDAASLIEDGAHPNDALTKAATEHRVPSGHVHLMVNAINTSRSNAQRLLHDDPVEKAAEYPLADTPTVLKNMFPDAAEKQAAARVATLQSVVAPEYQRGPRWLEDTRVAHLKQAKLLPPPKRASDQLISNQEVDIAKIYGHLRGLHQDMEDRRQKVASICAKANTVLDELRDYFTKFAAIPFKEVHANSVIYFGKQASEVLAPVNPSHKATINLQVTQHDFDPSKPPYSLIQQALKFAAEHTQARKAYESALVNLNKVAEEQLRPFGLGPRQGKSVLGSRSYKVEDLEKRSGLGDIFSSGFNLIGAKSLAKEIGSKMPYRPSGAEDERTLHELMSPDHDREIRNIRAEAMLNDLMANDDVIKSYDPADVVDSYNEVSQLTPYAAEQKAVMRDLIRKRLAGGASALDQFAISDAIRTQQALKELSAPNREMLALQGFNSKPPTKDKDE